MTNPVNALRFVWWNVQDFAHFDITRSQQKRWPGSRQEYAEKHSRVERVLTLIAVQSPPHLIALGEITHTAARELRDRIFPKYSIHRYSGAYVKQDLNTAILYDPTIGLRNESITVASNLPNTTRPIVTLDYQSSDHVIRFYVCHWTARFDKSSKKWRQQTALHLSQQIYDFLRPQDLVKETRHAVVLGDLNQEPYGMLEKWLYASRSRAGSRGAPHHTDSHTKRIRLYNCSWRMLGEHYSHPQPRSERETAGTYYWRDNKTWHTFDQVIVSGSLLTMSPPYLDEGSLRVPSWSEIVPDSFVADDFTPHKFEWSNGNSKGVSDHLPISGCIIIH